MAGLVRHSASLNKEEKPQLQQGGNQAKTAPVKSHGLGLGDCSRGPTVVPMLALGPLPVWGLEPATPRSQAHLCTVTYMRSRKQPRHEAPGE